MQFKLYKHNLLFYANISSMYFLNYVTFSISDMGISCEMGIEWKKWKTLKWIPQKLLKHLKYDSELNWYFRKISCDCSPLKRFLKDFCDIIKAINLNSSEISTERQTISAKALYYVKGFLTSLIYIVKTFSLY